MCLQETTRLGCSCHHFSMSKFCNLCVFFPVIFSTLNSCTLGTSKKFILFFYVFNMNYEFNAVLKIFDYLIFKLSFVLTWIMFILLLHFFNLCAPRSIASLFMPCIVCLVQWSGQWIGDPQVHDRPAGVDRSCTSCQPQELRYYTVSENAKWPHEKIYSICLQSLWMAN